MLKVTQTIDQNNYALAENIQKKALTIAEKQKTILQSPQWLRKIKDFFSSEKKLLIPLGISCSKLFDQIEKKAVLFSQDESCTKDQKQYHSVCLKTAEMVIPLLSNSKSEKARVQMESLLYRVAALQYRMEATNGGLDRKQMDPQLTEKLRLSAMKWKNNHLLIRKKELTFQEIKKLEEVSCYPQFAHVLLGSASLQESFFSWALRDNNQVEQFIQFPATCRRIKSAYLACRVGRLGGTMFPIQKQMKEGKEVLEKVICLPFHIQNKIQYLSILDESKEVEIKGWRMTIKLALDIFAKKNTEIGDLEFFGSTGITNWNAHELGSWNPKTSDYDRIDLTQDQWWKQLNVLEEISQEQLEARVGEKLEANQWIAFAKAARSTPILDLDGCHGYFELAIPTDKGTYEIYPFGNFAASFPSTMLELVLFVANTQKGKIAYPDENFFYLHRQQASSPIKLRDEQAGYLMKILQKELIKSRFGHVIFQFGAENCAYWAQSLLNTLDKKMHNYYKIDFVESTPLNPVLKKIFEFFRSVPLFLRPTAIKTVDTLLGSSRGIEVFENNRRVFKSYKLSSVRNELVIYQPGNLHRQIEKGMIPGFINTGNCR